MPIILDKLMSLQLPEVTQTYNTRDCIIYALGCGAGLGDEDGDDLLYVYEKGLRVLPTMATVLAHPGFWIRDLNTGIDWTNVVHGEQSLTLHRPLAPEGTLVGVHRIIEVQDKGKDRGALVLWERKLYDQPSGELVATMGQASFCRNDGGFGGPIAPPQPRASMPQGTPDAELLVPTSRQSAMIYRLSGDLNPLHIEPDLARHAGFLRPILHGLATFGATCRSLIQCLGPGNPDSLKTMSGRFSAPIFPGETLRVQVWRDHPAPAFRVDVVERNVTVLNHGHVTLSPSDSTSDASAAAAKGRD